MEKVGTSGRTECGGRDGKPVPGREHAVKTALKGALAAGALLVLLVTMFSTTERLPLDDERIVPFGEDVATSPVARMLPGHSIVAESLETFGIFKPVDDPQNNVSDEGSWPSTQGLQWPGNRSGENLFELVTSPTIAVEGSLGFKQVSLSSAESVERITRNPSRADTRASTPVERAPVPISSAFWLLAAGILGLLGMRMKYFP
jgi:hypothetical protein